MNLNSRFSLSYNLIKYIMLGLSSLACFLPRSVSLYIGTIFATILYGIYRLTPYRNHIFNNIKQTFPEIPDKYAHKMALIHVQRLTRSIVDFMRFPVLKKEFKKILTIEGIEHFEKTRQKGRGVILISSHFGCWELLGAIVTSLGCTLHVLVQKPSVPVFDYLFKRFRSIVGVKTHYNNSLLSIRPLIRALKKGEVIGLLIDQHGESKEVIGEFFNKKVSMPTGPAFFSLKTGAPIVPVFIKRLENDHHIATFYPEIEINKGCDFKKNLENITYKTYEILEKIIRDHPQDWLWIYNRWDKL